MSMARIAPTTENTRGNIFMVFGTATEDSNKKKLEDTQPSPTEANKSKIKGKTKKKLLSDVSFFVVKFPLEKEKEPQINSLEE